MSNTRLQEAAMYCMWFHHPYIIEVSRVDLGLNEIRRVRDAGEVEGGRMLSVLLLAQDFCRSLGLPVLEGAEWDPTSLPHPLQV